ncbi:MAG: GFA family protein, partial [Devosia sp.]
MRVDGQCHCGAITFSAEIDPDRVRICHCTDCQQLSGTAFRVTAPCAETDFRLLRGTPRIYVKLADSGKRRQQAFC